MLLICKIFLSAVLFLIRLEDQIILQEIIILDQFTDIFRKLLFTDNGITETVVDGKRIDRPEPRIKNTKAGTFIGRRQSAEFQNILAKEIRALHPAVTAADIVIGPHEVRHLIQRKGLLGGNGI